MINLFPQKYRYCYEAFSRTAITLHNKTLMTNHASLNVNDRFIRLSSV